MVGWAQSQARGSSCLDFGSGVSSFHIRLFEALLALGPRGPEPSWVVSLLGGLDVGGLSLASVSASWWRAALSYVVYGGISTPSGELGGQ